MLRLVSESAQPMSNRELSDATGIPKATVSRLAATLVNAGFLRQLTDSERFSLGGGLLQISSTYLRNFDLPSHARRHMALLAEETGAAAHLGVRDGDHIVLIEHVRPRNAVVISALDVGTRIPLATSAAGRAYIASQTPGEREALMKELEAAAGSRWRQQLPQLQAAFKEFAREQVCSSVGEWHPDINAVATTLRGARGELYALSCGGPASVVSRKLLTERVARRLVETAQAISAECGLPQRSD